MEKPKSCRERKEGCLTDSLAGLFARLKEWQVQNNRRKSWRDGTTRHSQLRKGNEMVKRYDYKCVEGLSSKPALHMCMCPCYGKQYLSSPCYHLSLGLLVGPAREKKVFTRISEVVELRLIVQRVMGVENTDHGAPSALLNMWYVWRWAHRPHWSTRAWLSRRSRWPRNSLTPFWSWGPCNWQERLPARESLQDTSSVQAVGTDHFLNRPTDWLP